MYALLYIDLLGVCACVRLSALNFLVLCTRIIIIYVCCRLPFEMGNMPNLKSLIVDGNPMRGIRRDIIAVSLSCVHQ